MAIIVNDSISNHSPKPLDDKYFDNLAPWADVATANAGIPVPYRHIGLTVNIAGVEYRYEAGTADGDLVVKSQGGAAAGVLVWDSTVPYSTFEAANNITALTNPVWVMLKGSGHQFDDLGGTGTTYSNCDKLFLVGQDGITQVQVNDKVFLDKHPVLFMNVLFMIWNTSDYYYTARQTPVYVGENCSIIPHDQNIPGIHVANGNTSFDLLRASYFSCPIRVEDGVNIQIRMYQRALMDTPCVYSIGSTLNSLLEIVRDASTVAPVQALNFDGQISDVLIDASDSTYFNNAITGLLTAVNVQGAIDELTNLTGAGVSVTNELVINNNETEIVGKQYQSIANADSYVQTQPTSVFNRFVTRFSGPQTLTDSISEFNVLKGSGPLVSFLNGPYNCKSNGKQKSNIIEDTAIMDIALDNSLLPALPESVIITEIQPYKVSILEYYFTNVPTTGGYNMFIGAETYIFNRNDTATSIQNVINSHFPDVVVTGTGTDIDPFIVGLYGFPGTYTLASVANIDMDAGIKGVIIIGQTQIFEITFNTMPTSGYFTLNAQGINIQESLHISVGDDNNNTKYAITDMLHNLGIADGRDYGYSQTIVNGDMIYFSPIQITLDYAGYPITLTENKNTLGVQDTISLSVINCRVLGATASVGANQIEMEGGKILGGDFTGYGGMSLKNVDTSGGLGAVVLPSATIIGGTLNGGMGVTLHSSKIYDCIIQTRSIIRDDMMPQTYDIYRGNITDGMEIKQGVLIQARGTVFLQPPTVRAGGILETRGDSSMRVNGEPVVNFGGQWIAHTVIVDGTTIQGQGTQINPFFSVGGGSTIPYTSSSNPTFLNDSVDSAGLGITFHLGDQWINVITHQLYQVTDMTTGHAIWERRPNFGFMTTIDYMQNSWNKERAKSVDTLPLTTIEEWGDTDMMNINYDCLKVTTEGKVVYDRDNVSRIDVRRFTYLKFNLGGALGNPMALSQSDYNFGIEAGNSHIFLSYMHNIDMGIINLDVSNGINNVRLALGQFITGVKTIELVIFMGHIYVVINGVFCPIDYSSADAIIDNSSKYQPHIEFQNNVISGTDTLEIKDVVVQNERYFSVGM